MTVTVIATFCEDIRTEASGSISLVGVLPDTIRIRSIPGRIPKLSLFVQFHLSPDETATDLGVAFRFPDKKERKFMPIPRDRVSRALESAKKREMPYAGFAFRTVGTLVGVPEAGRIQAVAFVGEREIICGVLNVEKTPKPNDANVSQPPASQSASGATSS